MAVGLGAWCKGPGSTGTAWHSISRANTVQSIRTNYGATMAPEAAADMTQLSRTTTDCREQW